MNQSHELMIVQQRLAMIEMQMKEAISLLNAMMNERNAIGEWVDEETAMRVTGLSKSSLYELRKANRISYSTISGRPKHYRLKDFENILNENERLR
ncbi:MAG: hypothetical protein JNL24_09155 [Bacteroidia bacterium]|nr:hypothetical protein [Bacteroidia bacterium]